MSFNQIPVLTRFSYPETGIASSFLVFGPLKPLFRDSNVHDSFSQPHTHFGDLVLMLNIGAYVNQPMEPVSRIGTTLLDLPLYRFSYLGGDEAFTDVMAQDVLDVMPEAFVTDAAGYGLLGIQMQRAAQAANADLCRVSCRLWIPCDIHWLQNRLLLWAV
jgi:hypothetical protein